MEQLMADNSLVPAIFGLAGTIVGGLLTGGMTF
jgi:hypothetical protein